MRWEQWETGNAKAFAICQEIAKNKASSRTQGIQQLLSLFCYTFAANLNDDMSATSRVCDKIISVISDSLQGDDRMCIIIHGGIRAGKTRLAEQVAAALIRRGIKIGGVLSPRILDGDETIGYTVHDLGTGEEQPFVRLTPPGIPIGRFYLTENGLAFARATIERATRSKQVVFVDEVGRLECDGKGHALAVRVLLRSQALPVLLVRYAFVERVVETFGIARYELFSVESGLLSG
jgi:nucleoside-triphosphatase THEP1